MQLSGISKSFGGTRALESVELALYAGSITALVGENGAGKSTLVKILTGIHQPDGGRITLCGKSVRIRSPAHAQQLGISVIHQEAVVFDELSVAENIFVTARPRRWGLIDWARMRRDAARLMERLDCPLDPGLHLRELSVAQKYLVQIARALSHDARLVIMDEPTAALSHHEAQLLLRIAAGLRDEGRALLFISHRLEDLFAIADRYVVFRDGRSVAEGAMPGTSIDTLIQCMVGRVIERLYPKRCIALGEEVLRVSHLSRAEEFADISFGVRRGEILGVYGLVGAGRSELMQSVFGLTRCRIGPHRARSHPDPAPASGRCDRTAHRLCTRGPAAPGRHPVTVDQQQHHPGLARAVCPPWVGRWRAPDTHGRRVGAAAAGEVRASGAALE